MSKVIDTVKVLWKKGLIYILIGTFVIKLISFFGSIFLVRVLSKRDYGILGYLENLYGYAYIFAGMGTSNAILRYVVLGKTIQEKFNYFYYSLKRGILWNVFLSIAVSGISMLYHHPLKYQEYLWLFYILMLELPFQYIIDNIYCNEREMF